MTTERPEYLDPAVGSCSHLYLDGSSAYAMFVLSLTMHVDSHCLEQSLNEALRRFPHFSVGIAAEDESLVFQALSSHMPVFHENEITGSVDAGLYGGYLIYVSYVHKSIFFRYHRALADEHGMISFIKAVLLRYLQLSGLEYGNDGTVKLLTSSYFKGESDDAMEKIEDIPASRPVWYMDAKAARVAVAADVEDKVVQIRLPMGKSDKYSDELSKIPVTFLAPLFSHAVYEQISNEMKPGEYVVAGININLRPYFPTASMRPFTTPVYLAYNRRLSEYPYQTVLMSQKKLLEAQLKTDALAYSAQRKISDIEAACRGNMEQKRENFRALEDRLSAMSTYMVSRIGNLILPEKIQRYVREFYPVLPSAGQAYSMTIVNYRNEMYLTVAGRESVMPVCARFVELMKEGGMDPYIADEFELKRIR